jgi:NDP-sugar pyrophosphorylase family protein
MAGSKPNGSGMDGTDGSRNGNGSVERDSAIGAGYIPPAFATGNGHPSTRALILAGGRGTRLAPYTSVLPKPLMPIGDRSILEIVIGQLARCGIVDITLCVGHLSHLIEAVIGDGEAHGVSIGYVREKHALGTAGPLRLAEGLDETFIVMNGDVLTTLDYEDLLAFHHRQEAALTIAMHSKRVDIDLGVIESENGLVTDYIEKPSLRYQVSMGIYVYALKYLPEDGPCQFPDLVLRLIKAGERVAAYECHADWFDIGTGHEHERAVVDIEQFPETYDVEAPLLDPHDVSRTFE